MKVSYCVDCRYFKVGISLEGLNIFSCILLTSSILSKVVCSIGIFFTLQQGLICGGLCKNITLNLIIHLCLFITFEYNLVKELFTSKESVLSLPLSAAMSWSCRSTSSLSEMEKHQDFVRKRSWDN